MDIGLEMLFHGEKHLLLLFSDSKSFKNFFLSGGKNLFIAAVKVKKISEMKKPRRNRKIEHPLIINAIHNAVRHHQVFKQAIHIGNGYHPVRHRRYLPKYGAKCLSGNKIFPDIFVLSFSKALRKHQGHGLL